jgi:flagellar motor switch protein FliG
MNMKTAGRIALFLALSLCVAQATLVLSFAQDTGVSVREETTTLENLYQEKVRSILNNLMAPEDYTLVISATIRNDDTKLKEYSAAAERKFLPGLPMQDPAGYAETNNILLELKQKVEIQVILTDNVPADRDQIVRDVIKNKLKLNEETGDSIAVVRAARSMPVPKTQDSPKLPELSAKMIAFWIIVIMMVLTGVILWLQRRKEKQKEAERAEQAVLVEQKRLADEEKAAHEEDKAKEEAKEELKDRYQEPLAEDVRIEVYEKLCKEKDAVLALCKNYPGIVTRAFEEFITQGHVTEAVIIMEALGWHESKSLFREMDPRFWSKLGAALRVRTTEPTLLETYKAVSFFHRFALSFVLERTAKEDGNPFMFVFKLNTNERMDLLMQEKAESIALIGVYCSGPQLSELLQGLEPEKQNDVLFHLTRIKQLPESEIRSGVDAFLNRLEKIKKAPSVYADGPMLAADFLRSLPAGREEELLQYLMSDHPAEGEKLRKVRVLFQDIPLYPAEMTRKIVEAFEAEDILKSLAGYDPGFVENFLSLLPTKKALMIQNDLFHMTEFPPASQCAEARRKICLKVEEEFENQRFSLADFWKSQESTQSGASINEEVTQEYDGVSPESGSSDDDGQGQAA